MATTNYTDSDRVRLAVVRGNRVLGPVERDRCNHGRVYSYRWTWAIGGTPEDGEAEFVSQKCQKCNQTEEG